MLHTLAWTRTAGRGVAPPGGGGVPRPGPLARRGLRAAGRPRRQRAAERLYKRAGFRFVAAKEMFYEDTGWMEFRMFEFPL